MPVLAKKRQYGWQLWTAVIRLAQLCWKTTLLAEADVRRTALKGQLSLLMQQCAPAAFCTANLVIQQYWGEMDQVL